MSPQRAARVARIDGSSVLCVVIAFIGGVDAILGHADLLQTSRTTQESKQNAAHSEAYMLVTKTMAYGLWPEADGLWSTPLVKAIGHGLWS